MDSPAKSGIRHFRHLKGDHILKSFTILSFFVIRLFCADYNERYQFRGLGLRVPRYGPTGRVQRFRVLGSEV